MKGKDYCRFASSDEEDDFNFPFDTGDDEEEDDDDSSVIFSEDDDYDTDIDFDEDYRVINSGFLNND